MIKFQETIHTPYAVYFHFVKMQNKTANTIGEGCIIYNWYPGRVCPYLPSPFLHHS